MRISEVARRTGIPVSTLRFYERELPGLFPIRKTAGGHRRYSEPEVNRFAAVRRLTREGLQLARVRRILTAGGDRDPLRKEVDLLLEVHDAETRLLDDLSRRITELEERVSRLEGSTRGSGSGRWFSRGRRREP